MFPWLFFPKPKTLHEKVVEALASITQWKSRNISKALNAAGFNVLGSGMYGVVIEYGDCVMKIFDADDDSYCAFLDLAEGHPNKHFPKIYGRGRLNEVMNFAIIEKLEPMNFAAFPNMQKQHEAIERIMALGQGPTKNANLREAAKLLNVTSRAFNNLKGFDLSDDLHTDNIMRRNETIVITDPWC